MVYGRKYYKRDGSGDRFTKLHYPDGCFTEYEHARGFIKGIHYTARGDIYPGTGPWSQPEGSASLDHPHHRGQWRNAKTESFEIKPPEGVFIKALRQAVRNNKRMWLGR